MYKPRAPKPCPTCNRHFVKAKPQEVYCSMECAILPRIQRGGENECWPWLGGCVNGYGAGSFQGRRYKVSRWILARKIGRELATDEQALHSCDNPPCCNPAHLFAGTGADNMLDKAAKGRARNRPSDRRGEDHHFARLSREDVAFIWAHRRDMTPSELAAMFGANRSMVWKVMNSVTWRSVTASLP